MEQLTSIMQNEFLGIALWVYAASLGSIIAGFVGKKIVAIIFHHLLKVAEKTNVALDDIVVQAAAKPAEWAVAIGGLYVALKILPVPSEPVNIVKFVDAAATGITVWLVVWMSVRLVDGLSNWWAEKAKGTKSKLDDQLIPILRRSLKVFLYVVGIVLVLQNLGYSVGSLLAGLGIGGAAIALASKDTVANLFGSIVIFLDKPFQIGDWIEMGDVEGTVEEVGLRTTRIRTFANSLITMPNSLLTTKAINNWSRMKKRRIKMSIGVTYSTSPEKLDTLVKRIREIIASDPKIHNDFYLVNFDSFSASSLDIFIYCFTVTTNWSDFLQAKQEFMLSIMRAVQELGIGFAFPTQSVHIESMPGEPAALTGQRPS